MKKLALAVLVAVIAASPAAALTKKKMKKEASAAPTTQSNNQNGANFAKDSLPIFLPSWTMPGYMAVSGRK